MPVKIHKPTSPGRRNSSAIVYKEITKKKPEKSLITIKKKQAGRNVHGKITVRHRGGGHKQFIRMVDFGLDKLDMPAKVIGIEYDPGRTARIALVQYQDGEKRYILSPLDLKVNDEVICSRKAIEIKTGNRLTLENIPVGVMIHNIELNEGRGGSIVRSAGSGALIQAIEGGYAHVRLPSGEIRMISKDCMATVGQVSNVDHENVRLGKAGRVRWKGIRPTVRGKAMNPVDHPHGGGEGGSPIGLKHPKTPWGKTALGVKTRKKGKYSDKFIINRRNK